MLLNALILKEIKNTYKHKDYNKTIKIKAFLRHKEEDIKIYPYHKKLN